MLPNQPRLIYQNFQLKFCYNVIICTLCHIHQHCCWTKNTYCRWAACYILDGYYLRNTYLARTNRPMSELDFSKYGFWYWQRVYKPIISTTFLPMSCQTIGLYSWVFRPFILEFEVFGIGTFIFICNYEFILFDSWTKELLSAKFQFDSILSCSYVAKRQLGLIVFKQLFVRKI